VLIGSSVHSAKMLPRGSSSSGDRFHRISYLLLRKVSLIEVSYGTSEVTISLCSSKPLMS